jgi:hypothetical protein
MYSRRMGVEAAPLGAPSPSLSAGERPYLNPRTRVPVTPPYALEDRAAIDRFNQRATTDRQRELATRRACLLSSAAFDRRHEKSARHLGDGPLLLSSDCF